MHQLPANSTTKQVLRQVNDIRERLGLPRVRALLRGARGCPYQCPVGRTIAHMSGYNPEVAQPGIRVAGEYFEMTQATYSFTLAFDSGMYPDLELP